MGTQAVWSRQNLRGVREFYTAPRRVGSGPDTVTLYDIWEHGGAYNDSVTPSVYAPKYRAHMTVKLLLLAGDGGCVFSLGCGNGFVEGDLARLDRRVRAVDCNEEAVELSRRKGVDAFTADYFALSPADLAEADVVYADGFLGHLFDAADEIRPALAKLESLALKSGTHLVFSNDAPKDPRAPFAPHEHVADFWFIAKDYLAERLASFGFVPLESYYYPYLRPLSGVRNRTICVARVP